MTRGRTFVAGVALFLCACTSDNRPDSGEQPDFDAEVADGTTSDAIAPKDVGTLVVHDAGGPISCNVTCDCPQGLACVDDVCTQLGTPVYCCEKRPCPGGQQCLDENDQPDICEGVPDPFDGGVRPDAGPGPVGAFCENDVDCDQTQGLECITRFDQPVGLWNYCALVDCEFSVCPTGTQCIIFNDSGFTMCMQECQQDPECREDAFCFIIQGAGFGICIPDCRDDFLDCPPADGTSYCNPATGLWLPCDFTPSHDNNALIGDPCINSTQCATGDICMGETGWNFDDGMCSHACSGLPESTPCPIGSSCQTLPPPFNGIGMCFRDCQGATCPDRPNAMCDVLDPSWVDPSCIPPLLP